MAGQDLAKRESTQAEPKGREQELALAQETQESLLPRCLPQFENFHIHAFNQPTRYVGGDFYDFLQLSSGEWMGVLADVSGKGMSAALLSSMVLGALSMEFHSGTQPEEVLNRVNRLLCEKSLPYQFVTLVLLLLGPDGSGQFINAGHNPAYLFRSATGKIEYLVSDLFALGMFDRRTRRHQCPVDHWRGRYGFPRAQLGGSGGIETRNTTLRFPPPFSDRALDGLRRNLLG